MAGFFIVTKLGTITGLLPIFKSTSVNLNGIVTNQLKSKQG